MIKSIAFFKRKPGIDLREFQLQWREHHAPLVRQLPGIRRYIQSYAIDEAYRDQEAAFDGYAELWLDDFDALKTMLKSPLFPDIKIDETRFIDGTTMGAFVSSDTEPVARPLDPRGVKEVRLLKRLDAVPVESFHARWHECHGAWAQQAQGLQGCVLSQALPQNYGRQPPPFDASTAAWFASIEACREHTRSATGMQLRRDEAAFADRSVDLLMTESVIVGA